MSHIIAGQKAIAVLDACRKAGIMIATAESCTGGLIAAALTDIPGSSDVVDRASSPIPTKPRTRCSPYRWNLSRIWAPSRKK